VISSSDWLIGAAASPCRKTLQNVSESERTIRNDHIDKGCDNTLGKQRSNVCACLRTTRFALGIGHLPLSAAAAAEAGLCSPSATSNCPGHLLLAAAAAAVPLGDTSTTSMSESTSMTASSIISSSLSTAIGDFFANFVGTTAKPAALVAALAVAHDTSIWRESRTSPRNSCTFNVPAS
jgi:hypothetical protein